MNIGILGTGVVGRTLGSALVRRGNQVKLGSRSVDNDAARNWIGEAGSGASAGTFGDVASFGEILLNCTAGVASLQALEMAGKKNLAGKILVDVANPLDFSHGFPPTFSVYNDDSLGEQIQRANPDARVVKALNTVSAAVMIDPAQLGEPTTLFICGNESSAKEEVAGLLGEWFGWTREQLLDLGDITAARGMEAYLALWVRMYGALGTHVMNVRAVRK